MADERGRGPWSDEGARVATRPAETPDLDFSLVNDPLLRLQRVVHLASGRGLDAVRRVLLLVLITWVPIVVWAAATGRLHEEVLGDSAMRHLGVHVRCLLAIPLLILSEPLARRVIGTIVANFVPSGLIRSEDRAAFANAIHRAEHWRDAPVVWLAIAALVVFSAVVGARHVLTGDMDALVWSQGQTTLDFGATWAVFVVRPLVLFLLLTWLWRLVLTWLLFRRIAGLDLQLTPSHPDRVGGLGFVKLYAMSFSLVVLAISSLVCSVVAHQMLEHGASIRQFQGQLALLVVLLVLVFLLPATAFTGQLRRTFLRGQFEYSRLASRYVRGVHERWVDGQKVEDDMLGAAEIGPVVDLASLYGLGTGMQFTLLGRLQVATLLLPAVLPVLAVVALEIPIKDILMKLAEKVM
jgi:hypothetical protein